jgi:hypothetical protein
MPSSCFSWAGDFFTVHEGYSSCDDDVTKVMEIRKVSEGKGREKHVIS